SRRRHTRCYRDWSSDVCSSDLAPLASVPSGLDLAVAAALPTPGVTALGIVEALEPLAGKTVLIVGAAGGVGSFATQLAAYGGAEIGSASCREGGELWVWGGSRR